MGLIESLVTITAVCLQSLCSKYNQADLEFELIQSQKKLQPTGRDKNRCVFIKERDTSVYDMFVITFGRSTNVLLHALVSILIINTWGLGRSKCEHPYPYCDRKFSIYLILQLSFGLQLRP